MPSAVTPVTASPAMKAHLKSAGLSSYNGTIDTFLANLDNEIKDAANNQSGWDSYTWDLDATQPLPEAPWFPPNATRSARRVFVHIVGETAQHAGHADILRETLDGAQST